MAEYFFGLSANDQLEALEYARDQTGRPAHLLEKDVWVVWTLRALFESPLSTDLTFKGGTSLSKAYKIIDRFSEDIDLTYDIRKLLPDLIGDGDELPSSRSQASKWTQAVRHRLPDWIKTNVQPIIQASLEHQRLDAHVEIGGQENDKLFLRYPPLAEGTGYVAPVITLEFGARATGEPHQIMPVTMRHGRTCTWDFVSNRFAAGHEPRTDFLGESDRGARVLCTRPYSRRTICPALA